MNPSPSLEKLLRSIEFYLEGGGLPTITIIKYWLELAKKAIQEQNESL